MKFAATVGGVIGYSCALFASVIFDFSLAILRRAYTAPVCLGVRVRLFYM